jgi:hypothetical protein
MSRARFGAVAWLLSVTLSPGLHGQQAPAAPAASVPRVVRLDGQFVPANGLPASAVETVTLALYATNAGGTPLFEETQDVAVDVYGRYTILLGASSAEGLPASLFAAGEPRWLSLRFARAGEGEQARVLLTSVPYAPWAGCPPRRSCAPTQRRPALVRPRPAGRRPPRRMTSHRASARARPATSASSSTQWI